MSLSRPHREYWRKKTFIVAADWDLLDPDADEVLLSLLARDAEPPPKRDMPHRRWAHPPYQQTSPDGVWRERALGWWTVTSYEDFEEEIRSKYSPEERRRQRREAERKALIAERIEAERETYRRQALEPPPPLSSWLVERLGSGGEYFQLWRYHYNGVAFEPGSPHG